MCGLCGCAPCRPRIGSSGEPIVSGVKWEKTSFPVGTLVRFKDRKSHRWEYGIYRDRNVFYEFSELPLGPVTRWLAHWPKYWEVAIVRGPESGGSGS